MPIEHRSISKQPEKQGKNTFRLSAATRVALSLLVLSPMFTSCVESRTPIMGSTPSPFSSYVEMNNYVPEDILINQEKLPTGYVSTDGSIHQFDLQEVKKVQQSAIKLCEPQIIAVIPNGFTGTPVIPITDSREHPKLWNLPGDVLQEDELAKNGVKIIQADNTNLYIRKQAFEEGGPLAELARQHGRETLTIVLVNGPVLASGYMKDKRYDKVRDLFSDPQVNAVKYKLEKVKEFQNQLESLRKKITDRKEGNIDYYEYLEVIKLKSWIYAYENNVITDNDIIEQKMMESSKAAGQYFVNIGSGSIEDYSNRVIFISVGNKQFGELKRIVYFDSEGKLRFTYLSLTSWAHRYAPDFKSSYPDPKDFSLNPNATPDNPRSYPYAGQSFGLVLRHELAHDVLIAQAKNGGKNSNNSEYDADVKAMEGIKDAWEKWQKSGFTDNSGYYFVFSLPKEQGGGYILTSNPRANKTSENA